MHPVIDVFFACRSLALGDLIFMMREEQVLSAAVDIKVFPEILHTHGGALNMPAGTAFSPGALPEGFAGFFGFP